MSKIAIVSDKTTLLNTIQNKLILLRSDDIVVKCDNENAIQKTLDTDVILLHTPELTEKALEFITTIKKKSNEIILILENYNPKILLKAYDIGIRDFCTVDVTNFELLIKIINAKKFLKKERTLENYQKILKIKGCIKDSSNIFTNITDIINENNYRELQNASLLALLINENSMQNINITEFENKLNLRNEDIVINYEHNKYLIILPKTSTQNASIVFNKIFQATNEIVKGIIFEYESENAKEIKNKIQRLETELENSNENLFIWNFKETEETEEDWLNTELSETHKNYKIFQNIYNKKIESVIEPVFYRIKQKYEHTLKNTKIKYYTDKTRSEFMIINFERTNCFQINFNNHAKLEVNLIYKGLDTPENEQIKIAFSEFTTRTLTDLLEDFIKKGEKNVPNR